MDYFLILQPLLSALWYLIPLAFIAALIKSLWFTGKAGDTIVNLLADMLHGRTRYHLIKKSVCAPKASSVQIDQIIFRATACLVVFFRLGEGLNIYILDTNYKVF